MPIALLRALRLATQSGMQSKTAPDAFIRRIKVCLGAPTTINVGAHKLARLLCRMLKFGKAHVETAQGPMKSSSKNKERTIRNLHRQARGLGFHLTRRLTQL